ncbi:MAG: hypothetical protein JNK31_07490 [Candidatus Competibacter sp.]|nr:hypothetical protein [Candidatus Competibacter sp.]
MKNITGLIGGETYRRARIKAAEKCCRLRPDLRLYPARDAVEAHIKAQSARAQLERWTLSIRLLQSILHPSDPCVPPGSDSAGPGRRPDRILSAFSRPRTRGDGAETALAVKKRHYFSCWDTGIVAAGRISSCRKRCSEGLVHDREDDLRAIDPTVA